MYFDAHVHSIYSSDGKSSIVEYADAFKNSGLSAIGFTEHVDFLPECGSFGYLDFAAYRKEISEYRNKGYNFFAGSEIDYNKSVEQDIFKHLRDFPYDYTICSVHMVNGIGISDRVYIPSVEDKEELLKIIDGYYKEMSWSIKAGAFDVLGHVGVYKRYLKKTLRDDKRIASVVSEAEQEIARLCAESGIIVEINTSGLYSLLGSVLPERSFLEQYFKYGGRSVCVGSDSHIKEGLGRGVEDGCRLLAEIGFTTITLPWDREKTVNLL